MSDQSLSSEFEGGYQMMGVVAPELTEMFTSLEEKPVTRTSVTHSPGLKTPGAAGSWFLLFGICLATLLGIELSGGLSAAFSPGYEGTPKSLGTQGEALASLVADLRKEKKLVGLAAMVTVDGQMVATAADGERMKGSGVAVDLGDRWHLGSITKSITSTMIARLIEAGQLQWSDTVGQRFPDAKIHDDWKPVTLEQLLTHTSGAPANFGFGARLKQPPAGPERVSERRKAVYGVIAEKPAGTPGKQFAYSNVGYTIAAAMAEQATGVSWEDLVKREVFEPLELTETGFGPPKSPDKVFDQPRGHRSTMFGKTGVSDTADNSPIMGPAGSVHMTLANLTKHGLEHLKGEQGSSKLLSTETFKRLHTPKLNDYACGWVVRRPTQAIPRTVYWHNGSNTMWYALVVFIPDKNMVVTVASNDGDIPQAESAAWKIVEWSAGQFKTEGDAELRKSLPAEYAKKSPFAAVRWQDGKPEVIVGDEWFKLVSLDGTDVADIMAFSEKTYGKQSRKRFEEDLVEVLSRVKHAPGDKVTLVVQSLTSGEKRTIENVSMTEDNRRAIKAAAMRRGE